MLVTTNALVESSPAVIADPAFQNALRLSLLFTGGSLLFQFTIGFALALLFNRPFPGNGLLRALLLQVLYSVRSERLLMEQLDYNLLFRWFVGLKADGRIWDATVFTKNRQRLLDGEIARAFFERVVAQARERGLLSDEHFTVDGTLIEAWASLKSFQRKGAPPTTPPSTPSVPSPVVLDATTDAKTGQATVAVPAGLASYAEAGRLTVASSLVYGDTYAYFSTSAAQIQVKQYASSN